MALLETLDVGKPISDTLSVHLPGSAYCVEWFAEAIDKIGGEVAPVDPKVVGLVTREAIGVVAAIVPWNYPIMMASWKFGPALAAGNPVIIKPSENPRSPPSAWPRWPRKPAFPMACSALPGAGDVGKLLALHMDVDCVAFTGSTGVGS